MLWRAALVSISIQVIIDSFLKHEENRTHHQAKCDEIVPFEVFFQIEEGKPRKYHQGDDLLDGFQLSGAELVRSDSVRGHHKAILQQGDGPARQDGDPERRTPILQMAVPGKSHKNVRNR